MLNTVLGGRQPVAARMGHHPILHDLTRGEEFSKTGPETMLESQAEMCAVKETK